MPEIAPALNALEEARQVAGAFEQEQKGMARPSRIALKAEGKTLFLDLAQVKVIQAQGNYVLLQTPLRSYLLRDSVSKVAAQLEHYGFVRIHRSTIVNACLVEEIRTSPSGETLVRVKDDGKDYCVSRKYRGALKLLATCWI
jgi:two-component system, LytTR family, response regulator